jgi:hypothetical protein
MRIIAFPGGGDAAKPEETWIAELEAALSGESQGATADSWRELREDVRALAPPMAPEFAQRLKEEFDHRSVQSRSRLASGRLRQLGHGRPALARAGGVAGAVVVAALVVLTLVLSSPYRQTDEALAPPSAVTRAGASASAPVKASSNAGASSAVEPGRVAGAAIPQTSAASAPAAAAPGRVQQLGAAVSLSTSPADVQTVSDGVARLAVRDEGFVEESHVQVQQHGSSEATLTLSLPSARLSAALAAIGQLAPVSAESQSLQDITDTYNAARQRLSDATAERQALLRALARATTEGQIDSLRERLSQARGAIAQAQSALQAVSRRASTAEVEVTVLGDARVGSEGLTLHRGLHDASRVLTLVLVALLIAAAVLVPLAVLIVALMGAGGAWRRYRREHALDST